METVYVKDEEFVKLTKKQKLEIPEQWSFEETEISRLVLIPTNQKNDSYCLGHFFAYTEGKGWWRPMTYDCWQINTEFDNPATPRFMILKGDFENGGVNIFALMDEHHTACISYGGRITIRPKNK